jgi:2'-5' RNA ligase
MAESAFIVRVPEVEPCVGALRERFDASVKLGVPAHITVLVPFMSPERITEAVLQRIHQALSEVPAFSFTLAKVRRFAVTAYLAPEPAASFIALTQSLVRSFPEYPPFGGEHESIIPHLTVAHGGASEAEAAAAELTVAMQTHGPIAGSCASVSLLLENSSGLWREMHAFTLPRSTSGG